MPLAGLYTWTLSPPVLATIALAGGVYAWRLRDLRRATGIHPRRDRVRAAAFGAGLLVLFVALASPLDRLGEERLFTAHMVQHLLLADLAPILLLLGLSRTMLRPAVRRLRPVEERARPARAPGRRAGGLRRADVAVARARDVRPGARARLGPRARARELLHRRDRVLVVPDRAGAPAPPPARALAARLPERGEAADGRARGGAGVLARRELRRATQRCRAPGASPRSRTSTSAGS